MIPRVATVLSAREWEAQLVSFVRASAAARLVLRAYQPEELEMRRDEIDVVVAGAETSWVTAPVIASWRRRGLRVVGVHPVGDSPARRILEAGGVDEILAETASSEAILGAIRVAYSEVPRSSEREEGMLVAVTGSRGAPGRSEVTLGLAWHLAPLLDTAVLDADTASPSLAIRLGLPARPDVADAADAARMQGELDVDTMHHRDGLAFIVGSHRPGDAPLRPSLVEDVVEAALGRFDVVIADLGPGEGALLKRADAAFLVAASDAVGIVRAARTCEEWAGPPPALILNRVPKRRSGEAVAAARRWLGLDPVVVIYQDRRIAAASRSGGPPAAVLRKRLQHLGVAG